MDFLGVTRRPAFRCARIALLVCRISMDGVQLTIKTVATVFTAIQNVNFALFNGSSVTWSLISTFGSKPSVAASFSKSPLLLFSSSSVSDMLSSVLSELLESLRDRSGSSSELWSSLISLTCSASAFKASITNACRMWRRGYA